MVLNMAIKVYFQLLNKLQLQDELIREILHANSQNNIIDQRKYILLSSLMSVNHYELDYDMGQLNKDCVIDLKRALKHDHPVLPLILKCSNKFINKVNPKPYISLKFEEVCFCLQSNHNGVKEELLSLLLNICLHRKRALFYFQCAVHFLPWTNKYKYYILGCAVKCHRLCEFIIYLRYSEKTFLNGLRLSLIYKPLLLPSQYFVKNISEHEDVLFNYFIVDILNNGSFKEITNLYNYWLPVIKNKRTLFDIIKECKILDTRENFLLLNASIEAFRSIVIFNVFCKEIFTEFQTLFLNFCEFIFNEHFKCSMEAQYFIYTCIAENMSLFQLGKSLRYIYNVFEHQKCCDNTEIRSKILRKVPVILEEIVKLFMTSYKQDHIQKRVLEDNILFFFSKIQIFIEENMTCLNYQNRIFALKLLEYLIKSQIVYNNTSKSDHYFCEANQLGTFLMSKNVFIYDKILQKIYSNLNNPTDYSDTRSILINLLQDAILPLSRYDLITQINKFCIQANIDECYLSAVYSLVLMNSFSSETDLITEMYISTLESLKKALNQFQIDALLACKTQGGHLFSYINIICNLIRNRYIFEKFLFDESLNIIQAIVNYLLSIFSPFNTETHCASFEEIDIGLELLVKNSAFNVECHSEARKFLLLSVWYTLKACCEISTILVEMIVSRNVNQLIERELCILEQCVQINVDVLVNCRHRGAIESAGSCIGRITKYITCKLDAFSMPYRFLDKCVKEIYNIDNKCVSTTRRGAGYPILFLNIVKNESNRYGRPILKSTLCELLEIIYKAQKASFFIANQNCDRLYVLTLHLLCVLIKDTEMKNFVKYIYGHLIIVTSSFLGSLDWSLCNGSLQLIGALVPKIVGQQQLFQENSAISWVAAESTYDEIIRRYPDMCEHILHVFAENKTSTRAIISFLDFFQRIDYLHSNHNKTSKLITKYRSLLWSYLKHACAKVRNLASICFIRAHEFRNDLPNMLLQISDILFKVNNENFRESIILVLYWGIIKVHLDNKYIIEANVLEMFQNTIKYNILSNFNFERPWKVYTISKLFDLLTLLNFNTKTIAQHINVNTKIY